MLQRFIDLKLDLNEQKVATYRIKGGNILMISCQHSCDMLPPFAHPNFVLVYYYPILSK